MGAFIFGWYISASILAAAHDPARAKNGMPHAGLPANRQRRLAIDVWLSKLSSQTTGPVRSFAAGIFRAEALRVRWCVVQGSNCYQDY